VADSPPIPVVKLTREKSYSAFKQSFETASANSYSAVSRCWFIGYKLQVIIFENGEVQQSSVTQANMHDINFMKDDEYLPKGKQLPGDEDFRSMPLQVELFQKFDARLKVPFHINQYHFKRHPKRYRRKRQMVETAFAQMTDQFSVKRNYA
jgi:hypothetical protein